MLGFSLVCLVALAQASNTVPPEIDQLNNLSLDDFEDNFGFDHITDPVERARREAALKENEDMVKKTNEAYINGEQTCSRTSLHSSTPGWSLTTPGVSAPPPPSPT